jgi:hypothetical protein
MGVTVLGNGNSFFFFVVAGNFLVMCSDNLTFCF